MLKRVILSTTYNKTYTDCAKLVTCAWEKHGFIPTLFVVGPKTYDFEVSNGTEIFEIQSISNVIDSFVAQNIRTVAPLLFPEDICITGDIDMVPMDGDYFTSIANSVSDDNVVIASSDAYENQDRYPICYLAATGKTFGKILQLNTNSAFWFEEYMAYLHEFNLGWDTDEVVFAKKLNTQTEVQLLKLQRGWVNNRYGRIASRRLDRVCWRDTYDEWSKMGAGDTFIDAHLPRPYKNDKVVQILEDIYVI